jgi:TorA maturation chaperone TorD
MTVSSMPNVNASEARARASVYVFLASLFHTPPTEDSVRAVREMAGGLEIEDPGPFALDDLEREYMDLFVVPNPRYVAPYESEFRDSWSNPVEDGAPIRGLLMGDSSLAVRRCYDEAGVAPADELPDHIATELQFMAWLWALQANPETGDMSAIADLRSRFRANHVARWIADLRGRVAERDRLGFYAAALQVAEAVIEGDA